jgi:hypothetical protein
MREADMEDDDTKLGGDYARDTHREGLGDDYARDTHREGLGDDYARDDDDDIKIGKASE